MTVITKVYAVEDLQNRSSQKRSNVLLSEKEICLKK